MKPLLILAALAASGSPGPSEDLAHDVLMDEIERQVRLPAGAYRMDEYGRYYAQDGKRRVRAVYRLPPEPVTPDPLPAGWGCEEILPLGHEPATREIPCPPDEDISDYLRAGQRRWVADRKALPTMFDGGCRVVNLVFDLKTRKVEHALCNGDA
jgi:hypothetical protein